MEKQANNLFLSKINKYFRQIFAFNAFNINFGSLARLPN